MAVRWAPRALLSRSLATLLLLGGCQPSSPCEECGLVRIAATGEPSVLLPPLVTETVGRDITDRIFERLARLEIGGSPLDPTAYRPGLAHRWERIDSAAWRFVLRPGATWHDGRAVRPADVVFSFSVYGDSVLGPPATSLQSGVVAAAEADTAVVIRFDRPYPESFHDAASLVRVLPQHLWGDIPRAEWAGALRDDRIIGSGPFRLVEWRRNQALVLERAGQEAGEVRRLVWLFAADQDAAANLVLAGQADLIETVTSPSTLALVERDTQLVRRPYPSAVYGFLAFRHRTADGAPDPILSERTTRRALVAALDPAQLARALVGPDAAVPPGPISRASWLWYEATPAVPTDPAQAQRWLDSAGWQSGPRGIRRRGGRPLAVDILVPGTSRVRRDLAQAIAAAWTRIGVAATVTTVDFPVFQERLTSGRFETMIGASLDDPSPRGLVDQWSRSGWGSLNYGRYASSSFDSLSAAALAAFDPARARALWREAFDTLAADAAALFLYTPTNAAVVRSRIRTFRINPFSWLEELEAIDSGIRRG